MTMVMKRFLLARSTHYVSLVISVIGISTSGNSPNVLEALHLARERAATTVGFTGGDGSPQIVLCTVNLHEYFIYVEGITKTLVTAFQTSSILGSKLVARQPDGFIAYDNTSFS